MEAYSVPTGAGCIFTVCSCCLLSADGRWLYIYCVQLLPTQCRRALAVYLLCAAAAYSVPTGAGCIFTVCSCCLLSADGRWLYIYCVQLLPTQCRWALAVYLLCAAAAYSVPTGAGCIFTVCSCCLLSADGRWLYIYCVQLLPTQCRRALAVYLLCAAAAYSVPTGAGCIFTVCSCCLLSADGRWLYIYCVQLLPTQCRRALAVYLLCAAAAYSVPTGAGCIFTVCSCCLLSADGRWLYIYCVQLLPTQCRWALAVYLLCAAAAYTVPTGAGCIFTVCSCCLLSADGRWLYIYCVQLLPTQCRRALAVYLLCAAAAYSVPTGAGCIFTVCSCCLLSADGRWLYIYCVQLLPTQCRWALAVYLLCAAAAYSVPTGAGCIFTVCSCCLLSADGRWLYIYCVQLLPTQCRRALAVYLLCAAAAYSVPTGAGCIFTVCSCCLLSADERWLYIYCVQLLPTQCRRALAVYLLCAAAAYSVPTGAGCIFTVCSCCLLSADGRWLYIYCVQLLPTQCRWALAVYLLCAAAAYTVPTGAGCIFTVCSCCLLSADGRWLYIYCVQLLPTQCRRALAVYLLCAAAAYSVPMGAGCIFTVCSCCLLSADGCWLYIYCVQLLPTQCRRALAVYLLCAAAAYSVPTGAGCIFTVCSCCLLSADGCWLYIYCVQLLPTQCNVK